VWKCASTSGALISAIILARLVPGSEAIPGKDRRQARAACEAIEAREFLQMKTAYEVDAARVKSVAAVEPFH
jgi:hypothetical protein